MPCVPAVSADHSGSRQLARTTNLYAALTVYEGDGENGIKIYFENEEDRQKYLDLGKDHRIVLQGNDTD
jgi:hypothetical protein